MPLQVGLIACNDYILIECCIYRIIKHNFSGHPAYVQIMDLFHEVRSEHALLMLGAHQCPDSTCVALLLGGLFAYIRGSTAQTLNPGPRSRSQIEVRLLPSPAKRDWSGLYSGALLSLLAPGKHSPMCLLLHAFCQSSTWLRRHMNLQARVVRTPLHVHTLTQAHTQIYMFMHVSPRSL